MSRAATAFLSRTDSAPELAEAVRRACALLAAGEVVALPTETVYGLAADALRPEAVAKIFEAKERPFFDPLIVHLPDLGWLEKLADVPLSSRPLAAALVETFWPGPLTLVLPRRSIVPDIVTSGLGSVALRMSAHPVFGAVAGAFGRPLAAPSANRFGRISPTTAAHVQSELGEKIGLIVDGGPTLHGVESTIVAVENGALRILRSGPITREQLEAFGAVAVALPTSRPEAPGQLESHYAPRTALKLLAPGTRLDLAGLPSMEAGRIGYLAFQCAPPVSGLGALEILSRAGDLREAAAGLFAAMRRLDEAGLELIVAEGVPEEGLGVAVLDRLRRASLKG